MTKFWLGEEKFLRQKILSEEILLDTVIAFSKTVINCYAKVLYRFLETRFRVCRGFTFHWSKYIPSKF